MRRRVAVVVLGTVLGALSAVSAQQPALGRISFPTSGSAAAQPAFVRGVLLLHSFEYDDAIAAFTRALAGDGDSIDKGEIDRKIRTARQKLPKK